MGNILVVLTGSVGSGKSTLAALLVQRHGARSFSSHQLLREHLGGRPAGRRALQQAGAALDCQTQGRWLAERLLGPLSLPREGSALLVVDAVRIQPQLEALRAVFPGQVVHVHLRAPEDVLAARYEARRARDASLELGSFAEVRADPTEQAVPGLEREADLALDTGRLSPEGVLLQVSSRLGLFGRSHERLVDVLVGGQYGSEGKGQICAHLAHEYGVLVRVGGPNAGHTVFEEPVPYTFHLLPSGTRAAPRAQVVLGPGTVLSLPVLLREIQDCGLAAGGRLFIDPQALLIEPKDVFFETDHLKASIGSTAQGTGAATARKVLRTAATPEVRLASCVEELKPFLRPTREVLDAAFARGERVFLEGTQGTGLSLHHGDYPYVTSRDTTASGCLAEAGIPPGRVRKTVLVCRTYPIRVQNPDGQEGGSSGPMTRELDWTEISRRSGIGEAELLQAERTSTTKRQRRVAEFDWALLRRAVSLNAPTDVALTFVDYLSVDNRRARRFDQLTPDTQRHIEELERVAGAPVSLVSTRFHSRGVLDRRVW